MNQADIALQLTLKAMDRFAGSIRSDGTDAVGELAKNTYTLYNEIYSNLFKTDEN